MPRPLTIVPAIDLRGGRCVRLIHGDPSRETRYDHDPVTRARSFAAAGVARLHVVDLDGAFGTGENVAALRGICRGIDVPVQTGGGIRTARDIDERFDAGAAYVILGTLLVEQPELAQALIQKYGDRIIAGVDARGSEVATHGWQSGGGRDRDDFVRELATWGVERIVYTEIARDGAGTGYDLAALESVAALTPLSITASGGAKTMHDLRQLAACTPVTVDMAIVGRAIYEGTIDLAEAVTAFDAV